MATLDEIGKEKERVAERLAKLDGERARLAEQLNELEIAQRVRMRFGGGGPVDGRRKGRTAKPAPAPKAAARRGGRAVP